MDACQHAVYDEDGEERGSVTQRSTTGSSVLTPGQPLAALQALRAHNIKVCHIMASHIDTNMAHKQQGTRCGEHATWGVAG